MNKQYRVKKSQEIETILNRKTYSANKYFSVYKMNNPKTSHFRYAISVGKKIGKAVVRNKVKRRITAALRELNLKLTANTDVFIIAKAKVLELTYPELLRQLEYLFTKQKLIKGEKND